MPYYLARVELRGTPTRDQYTNLHEAMKRQGFLQTIQIGGLAWELPHAEYIWHTGTIDSASNLTEKLKPIIAAVYRDYLLLVLRADDVSGYLVQVK